MSPALLLIPAALATQDLPPHARPSSLPGLIRSTGDLRYLYAMPPALLLNQENMVAGQGFYLDQRWRLGLTLGEPAARATIEADLLSGQVAGDPAGLSSLDERNRHELGVLDSNSNSLRQAYISGRAGPLRASAGLQLSHWGLGMMANDGAREPWFGRADLGDQVMRLSLATAPLLQRDKPVPLIFAVALDRVVADDTARVDRGQEAGQVLGSALYKADELHQYGMYGVYRFQVEADQLRRTDVGVLDIFLKHGWKVKGAELSAAVEAAGISGTTDRSLTYQEREQLRVASAGLATELQARMPDGQTTLALRGGWASGDGDPDDGVQHDFAFDRNFDVGMVLFDEVMGGIENGAYAQLTNPEHAGQPPDGVDAILTEGSFRRASFLQPLIRFQPVELFSVQAGLLIAAATAPIAQPFETYRNGGSPTNLFGRPTDSYYLGTEFDWAMTVGGKGKQVATYAFRPELRIMGGHLLASEDLLAPLDLGWSEYMVQGRLRW